MSYAVDFKDVSTIGLESSPVAAALAGMRAHEARYFKNKYDHIFTVNPASEARTTVDWVHRILEQERDIVISSRPLQATEFQIENIRIAYVFYESGLAINVMYTIDDPARRAVGFKLSEGMEVPRSSPRGSSSPARSRSWRARFAVRTSLLRTSTDPCFSRERHRLTIACRGGGRGDPPTLLANTSTPTAAPTVAPEPSSSRGTVDGVREPWIRLTPSQSGSH